MRTRCPHCRQAVEIVADDPLVELTCHTCGSAFNLLANQTSTHTAGQAPRLGRFVLLQELGCGAFGSVWKAADPELDRVVALKLPRREQMDEVETERFLREARAAAQLNHPGIVGVHEIGREGKQVYIVSDFIEGATLADWADAKPLTVRAAAELTAQAAEALHHAHQRGIVHRDLKPANILIDREGRPHLADFGLAKRDAGEITMTLDGQILGTPAYMSPEQARGEGRRVDGRADIYSLGVVLYELLTGELPFRGSSRMMILQIIHDEPPSPRRLRPNIPRDLETICLKCLAKDPGKRYPTAADLAADLRRWLEGEPVHARPAGMLERLAKWRRRNPAVAALAALVAAILLSVAVGALVAAARWNRLAEQELAARQEAESHFRRARQAVDEMLNEVGWESLANAPYMESVRRNLLEKALAFYRGLLDVKPTDPGLRQEVALAHHRVGRIHEQLGQHAEAKTAYLRAIAAWESLAADFPDELGYRHHLAVSHDYLGELLRQLGGAASQAEAHYRTALTLETELARQDGKRPDWRQELARVQNNRGLLLMETDRLPAAEQSFQEAIAGLTSLVADHFGTPDYRADLARALINLGVVSRKQHKTEAAKSAYERAIATLHELTAARPEDRDYRYKQAIAHLDLGNLLLKDLANPAEASTAYAQAREQLTQLQRAFPGIPQYALELANVEIGRANALASLGDRQAAIVAFQDAIGHLDKVASDFPAIPNTVAEYRSRRGIALGGLAYLDFEAGEPKSAQGRLEHAIQEQSAAHRLEPLNPEYRNFLAAHYRFLAQVLDRLGDAEGAGDARRRAERLGSEPEKRATDQ